MNGSNESEMNRFDKQYREILAAEKRIVREDEQVNAGKNLLPPSEMDLERLKQEPANTELVWRLFWTAQRKRLAPSIPVPPLEFIKQTDPKSKLIAFPPRILTIAAAVLIIFSAGIINYFVRSSSSESAPLAVAQQSIARKTFQEIENWQNSIQNQAIAAPAILREKNSDIEIFGGAMNMAVAGSGSAGKKWQIRADSLKGLFDFRSPVDVRIEHKLASIQVTGTRFMTDFAPKRGFLLLCEGSLRIRYQSPKKPDFNRELVLVAPARFLFNEEKISQKVFSCTAKDGRPLQLVYQGNGNIRIGKILEATSEQTIFEGLDGIRTAIPKEQILRVRSL